MQNCKQYGGLRFLNSFFCMTNKGKFIFMPGKIKAQGISAITKLVFLFCKIAKMKRRCGDNIMKGNVPEDSGKMVG